jgi:hypothetical protein
MRRLFCVVAVALLLSMPSTAAQLAYAWNYEELTQQSDVVLIGEPVSTKETDTNATLPELHLPAVELLTTFRVVASLRGSFAADTFLLRHYRLDFARMSGRCANCGTQVSFDATGADARSCDAGRVSGPTIRCKYLMFLKRGYDNVFEPTSGQVFPTSAIFKLPARPL